MGDLLGRGTRVMKNSGVKYAQAWAVQGWMNAWEEGHQGKKNFMVKGS